ncbi:MAG: class I SAM-dependent methyltransferase [Candidatus Hodarchaeales archaeon]|jgi:2-polyprenyl-3-methyl-5-hydroxy-6-metoxy-1,4-benzoquinol methylase
MWDGTGRIALILAKKGFRIIAFDRSEGMLARFNEKLAKEPTEIKQQIHIVQQEMEKFTFKEKFNTIICVDAFFHNLSEQEALNCLKSVNQHLTPQGRFLFNVPNPNEAFLQKCKASQGKMWTVRHKYTLAKTGTAILVEEAPDADIEKQLIKAKLRFTLLDSKGKMIERTESSWITRYMYQDQYLNLVEKSGLEVENLIGTYQNEPVTPTSQLIFQLTRNV